jgi:ATP-binding cassette subfamily B protein
MTMQTDRKVADTRWMWSFVLHHRRSVTFALLFGVVAGATAAVEPFLIGHVIDRIGQGATIDEIVQLILVIIGVAIVSVAAFWGQRQFSGEIAYSTHYDMRKVLFDNMLTLDQDFYQHYPTGDLISRMHADLMSMWRLLNIGFTRIGSAIFTLLIAFVILSFVSLPLTVIVFVVLAITTSFQIRAGLILAPVFEKVQDQMGVVSAFVQDSVSGIQTIKTMGKEREAAQKFQAENKRFRDTWLFFKRRNEPVGMLPNAISETTAGVVVLVGGLMAISGSITIGDFTSFIIYLGMVSQVLLQLGTIYQRYQQTRGALGRLTPLLQTTKIASPSSAKPIDEVRQEIRFDRVSLRMDGVMVLKDISLTIPANQTVAIVGPTGCGKTMLVNLLARVMDPTSGRVLFDGKDIRTLDLDQLRRTVAYVPQSTFLFSQELHSNIRMSSGDITADDLDKAINISRLANDLPQLPLGLDTMVGEKGVMLSGGQKQRVAIARAIVRDPSVLILDDAFSSIDMHTAADILGDLKHVLRHRTSILIAHRIATVKDADMIVVMDGGRVIEQGTHDELVALGGLYTSMVERELMTEAQRHGA